MLCSDVYYEKVWRESMACDDMWCGVMYEGIKSYEESDATAGLTVDNRRRSSYTFAVSASNLRQYVRQSEQSSDFINGVALGYE